MIPRGRARRRCGRSALAAGLLLAALAMLPACAGPVPTMRPTTGFASLGVPARVATAPPAEEIVLRFDEALDVRPLPDHDAGAALPDRAPSPVTVVRAGRSRLRLRGAMQPPPTTSALPPGELAAARLTAVERAEGVAETIRQLQLVQLAPWRAGVEFYSSRGLSLLVGSDSLVHAAEDDPVAIEHARSAFEGDSLAILGLRLRY